MVIDPGPDVENHVRALASRLSDAERVVIALTHGHGDHSDAAPALAAATGAEVWGPAGIGHVDRVLQDGDVLETDEGDLVAIHTPGHTREHVCFHWPARRALFVGDLVLGEGDTTWVAEYPGCVADYLDSLARVRALDVDVLYPAHGPPLDDVRGTLERYEGHRRRRIEQVREGLAEQPDADLDTLLDYVYGDTIPPKMRGAAKRSLEALVDFVRSTPD